MAILEVLDPMQAAQIGSWKVDVGWSKANGRASSEGIKRPFDERYLSLDDLWANLDGGSECNRSRSRVVQTADISVEAARESAGRLHLVSPKPPEPAVPTCSAVGKSASMGCALASDLRQLPATLAWINFQHGFSKYRVEQVKTIETEDGPNELRDAADPDYRRIHRPNVTQSFLLPSQTDAACTHPQG